MYLVHWLLKITLETCLISGMVKKVSTESTLPAAKIEALENLSGKFEFESTNVANSSHDTCTSGHSSQNITANVKTEITKKRKKRQSGNFDESRIPEFYDEYFSDMWYLRPSGHLNMRIPEVWAQGITGKGVTIAILSAGIRHENADLKENYNKVKTSKIFKNFNRVEYVAEGTRIAGAIVGTPNNGYCGVGVAYGATVGTVGSNVIDEEDVEDVETETWRNIPPEVDIAINVVAAPDDGATVDGPNDESLQLMQEYIYRGREGRGMIYVVGSGIGGPNDDNCNCDGFTSNVWTIAIAAVTQSGRIPWYSEPCSSILASTFSSGFKKEGAIVTTDAERGCTKDYYGTAAASSIAAGICALVLEVNKNLTWRDMQNLIVRTAKSHSLPNPEDWRTNGFGRPYSHRFGFGLMDAAHMVQMAKVWPQFPEQLKCEFSTNSPRWATDSQYPDRYVFRFDVSACTYLGRKIKYLEHVESLLTIEAPVRGNVEIELVSPSGTTAHLLGKRKRDRSKYGFEKWPFVSVATWDENPLGTWLLLISNKSNPPIRLRYWRLILFGREEYGDINVHGKNYKDKDNNNNDNNNNNNNDNNDNSNNNNNNNDNDNNNNDNNNNKEEPRKNIQGFIKSFTNGETGIENSWKRLVERWSRLKSLF